ncbi:DNA-directed RNA polymerase subunit alpha C-terminal domain-containing protein [Patescibacteria group bacterium]
MQNNNVFSRTESLEVLNIPPLSKQILINSGVKTVGKFYKLKRNKLLKIKGIGKQTARLLMAYKRSIKLIPYFDDPAFSGNTISHHSDIPKKLKYSTATILEINKSSLPAELFATDPIEVLGLPTRTENTLKMNGIETISDLYDCSSEQMMKFRNFGTKSIKFLEHVKTIMQPLLNTASFEFRSEVREAEEEIVDEIKEIEIPRNMLIDLMIERAKDFRSMDILKRRYGLGTGEKETLEEIGKSYGVTRERIRQIQKRAVKKIQHPSTKGRLQTIGLVEEMMYKNGIVLSDYEADSLVPKYFDNTSYDGSSFLDLLSDIGWVQKNRIGDVNLYAPKNIISKTNISKLTDEIYDFIKNEKKLIPIEVIITHFKEKYYDVVNNANLSQLILRLCRLDPRIEEKLPNKLGLYSSHPSVRDWRNHMVDILSNENTPLHFTEICEEVNAILRLMGDKRLDVRRVHSILIENVEFSHTGVRGTYGLTKWGLRKEMTPVLVEEILEKSGRPLHWRQIYNYVKKYKDTKEANILAILNSNEKFMKHGHGEYVLKK